MKMLNTPKWTKSNLLPLRDKNMSKKQEQAAAPEKTPASNAEECQQISDKCDTVIKKIKTRPRTKKRVKND